jgi:Tol biopolymer transport system component
MKTAACFAMSILLVATGCGPEAGMIDPTTRSDALQFNPGSARSSEWSEPASLGVVVNSSATEQQPALSKDGLSLYFASNRSGGLGGFDIWVARRACTDECDWGAPQIVPVVNTEFPDISPSLSRDGHQLFFASQRSNGHCTVNPPTIVQCDRDLWVSYRQNVNDDSGWQEPVNLGDAEEGINSSSEELAPSYLENDETGSPELFFNDGAVSGAALLGGDIYVSRMVNGIWGRPSKVPVINSSVASDQRPSISHDGLELYFWSDRDGASHLWVARRGTVSDSWSEPTRVEFPTSETSDPDTPTIQPFIYSHGKAETLLFVRGSPGVGSGRDLWMSERQRTGISE